MNRLITPGCTQSAAWAALEAAVTPSILVLPADDHPCPLVGSLAEKTSLVATLLADGFEVYIALSDDSSARHDSDTDSQAVWCAEFPNKVILSLLDATMPHVVTATESGWRIAWHWPPLCGFARLDFQALRSAADS